MRAFPTRFLNDDSGATAIEYGLIAAMVAIIAIGALSAFGQASSGAFNTAMNAISDAISGSETP
jgi:pilus assembly protein Flp/PilA